MTLIYVKLWLCPKNVYKNVLILSGMSLFVFDVLLPFWQLVGLRNRMLLVF